MTVLPGKVFGHRIRIDPNIVLILALSLFVWAPMVNDLFFFNAHDARHSVFFLIEFDQSFKDGAWYPRWGTDFALGYGYPLFNVYASLSFYVAECFHLAGLGYVEAVKGTFALGWILSGAAMYGYGRHLFGRSGGLLAAAAYTFAPYRIADVYVRGAMAESFAFVFMPLVLWSFGLLAAGPPARTGKSHFRRVATWGYDQRHVVFAGASLAGLVLTHNGTALIFAPVAALYTLWLLVFRGRNREFGASGLADHDGSVETLQCNVSTRDTGLPGGFARKDAEDGQDQSSGFGRGIASKPTAWLGERVPALVGITAAGILALGLSAVFWLPMLAEARYVQVDQWTAVAYDFKRHFLYLFQFLSPSWGYGYSGEGIKDEMPFQLGLAALSLAALAILPLARGGNDRPQRGLVFFFTVTSAVAAFVMLGASAFLWDRIPAASLVQFPWRLLALTAVTLAVLAGAALPRYLAGSDGSTAFLSVVPLLAVIALASYSYLAPRYTPVKQENITPRAVIDFEMFSPKDRVGATKWVTEQPTNSPLVPQYQAGEPLQKAMARDPRSTVETIHHGGSSETVRVFSPGETEVVFYTYYFPGWTAKVDQAMVPIYPSTPQGLVTLRVPAGEHEVGIRFGDTPVRTIGMVMTLLSAVASLGLILAAFISRQNKAVMEA